LMHSMYSFIFLSLIECTFLTEFSWFRFDFCRH
jgi:hypothetical protein